MPRTITAEFATRREAELAVERLVQELDVPREAVAVAPVSAENSAGVAPSGSDGKAGEPSREARGDAALAGAIRLTATLDGDAAPVEAALRELGGDKLTNA